MSPPIWPILRMPPDFCANAVPRDKSSSAPAAASTQRSRIIIHLLFMTPAVTTSDAAAGPFFRAPAKRQRWRLSYFERPVHLLLGESSDGSLIRDKAPVPPPPSREAICRASGLRSPSYSHRTGNKEIWSMDYDGSNQKQMTSYRSISQMTAVSADVVCWN